MARKKRTPEYRKARHALTERIRYLRNKGFNVKPFDIDALNTRQMKALTTPELLKISTIKVGANVEISGAEWALYLKKKKEEQKLSKKYGFDFIPVGGEYFSTTKGFKELLKGTIKRSKESYYVKNVNIWFKNSLKPWYSRGGGWKINYLYFLYKNSNPVNLLKRMKEINGAITLGREIYYQMAVQFSTVEDNLKENALLLIKNETLRNIFLSDNITKKEWYENYADKIKPL